MKPRIWQKNMVRTLVWLDPHQRTPLSRSLSLPMASSRGEGPKELLLKEAAVDAQRGKKKGAGAAVPRGFLAVYVGRELRRFLIPAEYLSMPDFRGLMERAEEEFGFQQEGGLRLPCEEDDFEEVISRCRARQRRSRSTMGLAAKTKL